MLIATSHIDVSQCVVFRKQQYGPRWVTRWLSQHIFKAQSFVLDHCPVGSSHLPVTLDLGLRLLPILSLQSPAPVSLRTQNCRQLVLFYFPKSHCSYSHAACGLDPGTCDTIWDCYVAFPNCSYCSFLNIMCFLVFNYFYNLLEKLSPKCSVFFDGLWRETQQKLRRI